MPDSRKTPRNCPVNALAVSAIKIGIDAKIGAVVLDIDGKENRPGIVVLTCTFLVEQPGIEPASLPGNMPSELQLRFISFQFSPGRYQRFRSRVLTASRVSSANLTQERSFCTCQRFKAASPGIGTALTSTVMEDNDDSPDEAVGAELHDSDSTAIWDQDDAGGDATEVVPDITQAAPELAWSAGNPGAGPCTLPSGVLRSQSLNDRATSAPPHNPRKALKRAAWRAWWGRRSYYSEGDRLRGAPQPQKGRAT